MVKQIGSASNGERAASEVATTPRWVVAPKAQVASVAGVGGVTNTWLSHFGNSADDAKFARDERGRAHDARTCNVRVTDRARLTPRSRFTTG